MSWQMYFFSYRKTKMEQYRGWNDLNSLNQSMFTREYLYFSLNIPRRMESWSCRDRRYSKPETWTRRQWKILMQYTRNGRIVPTLQAVESIQAVTQMILEEKHGRTNLGTIFKHHKEHLRDSGPENEKTRCALYSSTAHLMYYGQQYTSFVILYCSF